MHNQDLPNKNPIDTGRLYVVATPIGNLEDITYRAVRILSEVDIIICEDTRRTLKLLNHLDIKKRLLSYHTYNEKRVLGKIIAKLKQGENLALVSDSGTPCISDPGTLLVSEAVKEDILVLSIPGPSALLALLSASGFPASPFQFIGFLSPKKNKRLKILGNLLNYKGVIILYESPHRILKLIDELSEIFSNCPVLLGRELTKKFEESYRGTAKELSQKKDVIKKKGEYTILINNFSAS